ncbi:tRNA (adenosine(37)-N6)-threonylcarbamoyltransferase complex ATPase subunit type 1 TsaE [Thiohalobacter thiocyanaticus]|uniref:tRNA threonylcarbamoyladenosine biosynthesis protein TsaE n=1 Tax=Thiohalobacter thiocyanaticus TaxID=585455 RepID=A0A426QLL8_9GAMM|nr:tRNA (adenosine(37)-N6)-threonylcarbamoyltransferase complex ATPase subunit type 1 TsaE [Thiohalobacter thiocyanaticus]RRQ22655.1 tRNA (adenosine(37)-N6)-threonylcarbamoyltransferase complex ATPase subunit type 1 TsaE [Thiohalobacter thiocyanaticus]
MTRTLELAGEAAMEAFGARLARLLPVGLRIHLQGDLGAGKTTLVRGFLRGLGYAGRVKSPTYTLIEPYWIDGRQLYHLDLYRLADPEELEFLGIRDLFEPGVTSLIEWPERGAGLLPPPDLLIRIEHLPEGRRLSLERGPEPLPELDAALDAAMN